MGQEPSKWDRLNSGKSAVNATTTAAKTAKDTKIICDQG